MYHEDAPRLRFSTLEVGDPAVLSRTSAWGRARYAPVTVSRKTKKNLWVTDEQGKEVRFTDRLDAWGTSYSRGPRLISVEQHKVITDRQAEAFREGREGILEELRALTSRVAQAEDAYELQGVVLETEMSKLNELIERARRRHF